MKNNSKVASVLIFCLMIIFLLNNIACFKRVPVALEQQHLAEYDVLYIFLKSHEEYKIYGARLSDDYLVGYKNSKQDDIVRIPIAEIQSIEVVRPDKKKALRNIGIGLAIFIVAGFTLFKDYNDIRED